jgi:Ca2+-binding EF-hand superfamily protein
MGNKASAQLLPPVGEMLKTFSPAELQALEARFPTHTAPSSSPRHQQQQSTNHSGRKRSGSKESSPHSTFALVTKAQFVALLGEGPSMKRVLLRLFAVLDANGTGALEYQEHVSAAYFLIHATAAERARVLFSMYEPTSSSSSLSSPSATAASKAYLSREHVATLCAETTLALTEVQVTEGENGRRSRGIIPPPSAAAAAAAAAAVPAVVSLTNINATAPPFKDLIGVMVDVAFLRWDTDKDGKLSFAEFHAFVTQQNDNGVGELLGMLLASPQVPKLLFDGGDGGGEGEARSRK